jgi:hypothetical protein
MDAPHEHHPYIADTPDETIISPDPRRPMGRAHRRPVVHTQQIQLEVL